MTRSIYDATIFRKFLMDLCQNINVTRAIFHKVVSVYKPCVDFVVIHESLK